MFFSATGSTKTKKNTHTQVSSLCPNHNNHHKQTTTNNHHCTYLTCRRVAALILIPWVPCKFTIHFASSIFIRGTWYPIVFRISRHGHGSSLCALHFVANAPLGIRAQTINVAVACFIQWAHTSSILRTTVGHRDRFFLGTYRWRGKEKRTKVWV